MGSTDKGKVKETKAQEDEPQNSSEGVVKTAALELEALDQKMAKSHCCHNCFKALFVVLSIVTLLKSIAEIAVTVTTAIATKLYGSEESGRLVGMVILALLAAVTVSILIYALVAVFRNQARPLHAASLVLFVVAAIQAVVAGVAVRVSPQDETQLTRSLLASFELARENNPRHAALWSATQYELNCCGVYGPDDYRSTNLPDYFAPNVPISCCPSYDPDRSELIQEREREICKKRKSYYDVGCRGLVMEGFRTSAHLVLGCTIALIVLEILLSIISAILVRKINRNRNQRSAEPEKVASTSP